MFPLLKWNSPHRGLLCERIKSFTLWYQVEIQSWFCPQSAENSPLIFKLWPINFTEFNIEEKFYTPDRMYWILQPFILKVNIMSPLSQNVPSKIYQSLCKIFFASQTALFVSLWTVLSQPHKTHEWQNLNHMNISFRYRIVIKGLASYC